MADTTSRSLDSMRYRLLYIGMVTSGLCIWLVALLLPSKLKRTIKRRLFTNYDVAE